MRSYRWFPLLLALIVAADLPAQQAGSAGSATQKSSPATVKLSKLPPAVRDEIDRLASDDPGKMATAATSLGEMGEAAIPAIPFLVKALEDPSKVFSMEEGESRVCDVALSALKKLGAPARDAVLEALNRKFDLLKAGEDPIYLDKYMDAAGKMKDRRAFPLLLEVSKHKEWHEWAASSLGELGDTRAVEPLIEILKSGKQEYMVVTALGQLKDPRAVEPLIAALADDEKVQYHVVPQNFRLALKNITGQNFNPSKERAAWWAKNKDSLKRE